MRQYLFSLMLHIGSLTQVDSASRGFNMKLLSVAVLSLCLVFQAFGDNVIRYDGYRVLRFIPEDQQQVDDLVTFKKSHPRLDFWKGPSAPGRFVDLMLSPDQLELGYALNHIKQEVFIGDVQAKIDESFIPETVSSSRAYNTSKYYTSDELDQYLADEAANCGADCSRIQIGISSELRELYAIKISRPGTDRTAIWIDGGIHAREWLAQTVASYMVDRLINDYGTDPQITAIRDAFDFYIMNNVNPDGYTYTWGPDRMWRKTRSDNPSSPSCPGADGNRNFDDHWDQGVDDPCSLEYSGQSAASEPEISSIQDFIVSLGGNVQFSVNLHTYGQWLVRPWGYTIDPPADDGDLDALGDYGVSVINLNSNSPDPYRQTKGSGDLSGLAIDWQKAFAGVKYAYDLELRDRGDYGFLAPVSEILPTCVEASAGIFAMAESLIP